MPQRPNGHAALDVHRRLKPDEMLLRRSLEMHTAQEPQAEDGDAALGRRTAACQYRWEPAILLHHIIPTNSHD
jgi:hypothetical protein